MLCNDDAEGIDMNEIAEMVTEMEHAEPSIDEQSAMESDFSIYEQF